MPYRVKTAPASEPLTTSEVKDHLKVDFADDDTLIDALIVTARIWVEQHLNRALISQTIEQKWDCFPSDSCLKLRLSPVSSVTHVKYIDSDGDEQTLTVTTDYKIDTLSEPTRIRPAYGTSFPSARNEMNAITVEFVAGYSTAADVPSSIKQAMLLMIGKMYETREDTVKNLPSAVEHLLAYHRVII